MIAAFWFCMPHHRPLMRERTQRQKFPMPAARAVCAPASRRIFARWVGQREGERYRAFPRNGSRAKSAGLEAECCEGSLIRPTRCCERRMPCSDPMTGCRGSSVRPDRVISSFGIWYRWCTDPAARQLVVPPFITDFSTQRSKRLCCEAGLTFKAYRDLFDGRTYTTCHYSSGFVLTSTVATSIYTAHSITLTEVTIPKCSRYCCHHEPVATCHGPKVSDPCQFVHRPFLGLQIRNSGEFYLRTWHGSAQKRSNNFLSCSHRARGCV